MGMDLRVALMANSNQLKRRRPAKPIVQRVAGMVYFACFSAQASLAQMPISIQNEIAHLVPMWTRQIHSI